MPGRHPQVVAVRVRIPDIIQRSRVFHKRPRRDTDGADQLGKIQTENWLDDVGCWGEVCCISSQFPVAGHFADSDTDPDDSNSMRHLKDDSPGQTGQGSATFLFGFSLLPTLL